MRNLRGGLAWKQPGLMTPSMLAQQQNMLLYCFSMTSFREKFSRTKPIIWLLIMAVVVLSLLPAHMHLHHVDGAPSATHEHAIDIHLAGEKIDPDHHDDAMVLSATPDVLVKNLNDNPLLAAIWFGFVLFLVVILFQQRLRPLVSISLQHFYPHFSPPLRAPPQH